MKNTDIINYSQRSARYHGAAVTEAIIVLETSETITGAFLSKRKESHVADH